MSIEDDVHQVRILIAALTRRVHILEQRFGVEPEAPPAALVPHLNASTPISQAPERQPEPPTPIIPPHPVSAQYPPGFSQRARTTAGDTADLQEAGTRHDARTTRPVCLFRTPQEKLQKRSPVLPGLQ